jgi:putative RNA 2'-phosphotransferase
MDPVKTSKLLSLVLRHEPGKFGLTLDAQGWVEVATMLDALARRGRRLTRAALDRVVAENDKQRFELSADGARIRARQGHSVPVDLALEPSPPPAELFHGTVAAALAGIRHEGLTRRNRHHVHLSPDAATATKVGARRGKPIVLTVASGAMARAGHVFYRTGNNVWLTDTVPPQFIRFPA